MVAKETIASTASEYPLAKFVIGQIPNPRTKTEAVDVSQEAKYSNQILRHGGGKTAH